MRWMTNLSLACWIVVLSVTTNVSGQISPVGVIRDDTVWSGEITISSDVVIIGATVRVEPGSRIQFISSIQDNFGPSICLDSPSLMASPAESCGKLILAGTAQEPIIVETPEGKPPGSIISGEKTCGSIIARHVHFRRLGTSLSEKRSRPAILLQLTSPDNDLWMTDCRFSQCGPVQGEFFGPGASAEIQQCVFRETLGDFALIISGSGSGSKVIVDNFSEAGFRIECSQVLIHNNILIGTSAAIAIPTAGSESITIAENYIHGTTQQDNGRYIVKCEAVDAIVRDNVLIGGTYVIETAPRTVTGNVLIGVTGLIPDFGVAGLSVKMTTSTHYLIGNLAPHALVAENLLLGPVYAAIVTGKRTDQPRIEHNIFDGWQQAGRAVHFNMMTRKPIGARLNQNVIVRYQKSPVADQAGLTGTLSQAKGNIFAKVPEVIYEKIADIDGLSDSDKRFDNLSQAGFQMPLTTQSAATLEEQLVRGKITINEIRKKWMAIYHRDK